MTKLLCAMTVCALFVFFEGPASLASRATGHVATTKTAAKATAAAQEPEGSEHCKRATKDNPDGCKCVYKCVDGQPQEDNSDPEHRCHNFCKKDQCDCQKPSCKS